MKPIKFLQVALLFFVFPIQLFATNKDSAMVSIIDLLDKKHCYEVSLNPNMLKYSSDSKPLKDVFLIDKTKCENVLDAFSNYKEAVSNIKSDKNILLFIEDEINKGDSSALHNRYIFYNYNAGYNTERGNRITYFDFLKIIKHSIFELNMSELPSLQSNFAECNCDSLIENIQNVLKLKHNYEASLMYQQKKETTRTGVY